MPLTQWSDSNDGITGSQQAVGGGGGGGLHPRGKLGGGVSQWSDTCTKPQWKDQGLHQLLTRWELWGDF